MRTYYNIIQVIKSALFIRMRFLPENIENCIKSTCFKFFYHSRFIYNFTFFDFFGDAPDHARDKCFVAVTPAQ